MDFNKNLINQVFNLCELDIHARNKDSQLVVTYPPLLNMKSTTVNFSKPITRPNTLYVHIPYCTGICSYCNYVTKSIDSDNSEIADYINLLKAEVEILKIKLSTDRIPVESIYIGGGTPTMIDIKYLKLLFDLINDNFVLNNGGEYTLEGCPETMSYDKLLLGKSFGVNRISIGVETFDDKILSNVRRRHTSSHTEQCINDIRRAGFDHFDIDLINNLPSSDVDVSFNDCQQVIKHQIPSVTLYHYHVKPKSIDAKKIPSTEYFNIKKSQIENHLIYKQQLSSHYNEYMFDWFEIDNHKFQHQILKWTYDANQLTLGIGCYGYFEGTQYRIHSNLSTYRQMLLQQQIPVISAHELSPKELQIKKLIFNLRLKQGFLIEDLTILDHKFKSLIELGLLEQNHNRCTVTEPGSLFLDEIQRYLGTTDSKY
jgi:oxygen-independent coproporphyrinogen-3 oxidase